MSGIGEHIVYAATRIKSHFSDDLGNSKVIFGSGFCVVSNTDRKLLVTNKHNLCPKLKLGAGTEYKLTALEIMFRKRSIKTSGTEWFDDTLFFHVLEKCKICHSDKADVSIIFGDYFPEIEKQDYGLFSVIQSALADHNSLKKIVAMDIASFIGYPCGGHEGWWDEESNFPIARTVNVAFPAHRKFNNKQIATDDVGLVSGLSFGGSSGSMIISHQKGIAPFKGDITVTDPNYLPPKIIGIMSGHWNEESSSGMFSHSGLSYYTRSTAIIDLIAKM